MEEPVRIDQCNSIRDFRLMARRRLPGPIFHYIDGAADDEVTYRRNTETYERCDLVPNVLAGVESIDMSTTVMGQKLKMPLFCSPTALQRLFHHDGERAVAKAAEKFGTMFGVSSLGTVSVEEIGSAISTPKLFQLYFHKDRGGRAAMPSTAGRRRRGSVAGTFTVGSKTPITRAKSKSDIANRAILITRSPAIQSMTLYG
jgi:L-lactate dehydrogenase (cytochrome)